MGGGRETERLIEILYFAWYEEDTARILKRDACLDSSGRQQRFRGEYEELS